MFNFQESIVATNVQIEQDKGKKEWATIERRERETDRVLAIYLTNGPFQPNPIWIVTNFFSLSRSFGSHTSYREINPINVKLINTQKVKLLLLTKIKSFSSFFSMKDALICLSCVRSLLSVHLAIPSSSPLPILKPPKKKTTEKAQQEKRQKKSKKTHTHQISSITINCARPILLSLFSHFTCIHRQKTRKKIGLFILSVFFPPQVN